MKTYLDCIPCFTKQTLEGARLAGAGETVQKAIMDEVLAACRDFPMDTPPPAMGAVIHRIIRKITGSVDPYLQQKNRFNRFLMERIDHYREMINSSADPLMTAVKLAVAGNIIDFGIVNGLDETLVEETIKHTLKMEIPANELDIFRRELEEADSILYLGDNCGEVVFDRLLLEQLPLKKITFAVRGNPVLNDITYDDARETGIDRLVPVIDNGSDAPGTVPSLVSPQFKQRMEQADLIISKGQGNYEGLNETPGNFRFLFKAKCAVVARHCAVPVGTPLFLQVKNN